MKVRPGCFAVLASRAIAIAIIIFLTIKGCEYAYWMWKAMTATIKSPAIVLTEEAHIKIMWQSLWQSGLNLLAPGMRATFDEKTRQVLAGGKPWTGYKSTADGNWFTNLF